jgi:Spy/CpxP family protein refolding chaperone
MLKKLTMAATAASLALTVSYAQPGMQSGMHGMHGAQQMQQKQMRGKKRTKGNKGMRSVFLIQHGLPHYAMILTKLWDDPKLALTPEQKTKLEAIRTRTVGAVKELAPQVKQLRKKIVQGARSGAKPETLAADVDRLASLKAKGTKIQLACLYETRQILTPEQLKYVDDYLKNMRKQHKKRRKQNMR